MKSASSSCRVEATSPPTFTDAPGPNRMPLGLIKNTWPFDVRLPKMAEASAPITRLSATEARPGCTNCTDCPAPMPKLCHWMATFGVVWVMVMRPEVPPMAALPALTTPPVGLACARPPQASIKAMGRYCHRPRPAQLRWAKRVCDTAPGVPTDAPDFLVPLACSEVATQVRVWGHQMDRKMWFMARSLVSK